MWICPNCQSENDSNIKCKNCGLDETRNYKKYFSVTVLSEKDREDFKKFTKLGQVQKELDLLFQTVRRELSELPVQQRRAAIKELESDLGLIIFKVQTAGANAGKTQPGQNAKEDAGACGVTINGKFFRAQNGGTLLDLSQKSQKDMPMISDLGKVEGLEKLESLETLYLSHHSIRDVSLLKNLPGLKALDLSENMIKDIAPLSALKKLHTLSLNGNQIKDIRPLSDLKALEELNLSYNGISDLSPLLECRNLKKLWLGFNDIKQVAPLSSLTNLRYLDLSCNRVKDIRTLSRLIQLKEIHLLGNKIGHPFDGMFRGAKVYR